MNCHFLTSCWYGTVHEAPKRHEAKDVASRLTALCPQLPRVSWDQEGKTNLDLLEQETASGTGINWAICKSAP